MSDPISLDSIPSHAVGKLYGNIRPVVLPCGHVQLGNGMTVEFEEARRYSERLREALDNALTETARQWGHTPQVTPSVSAGNPAVG